MPIRRWCGSQTCSTGPMSCRYHSITQWGSKYSLNKKCLPSLVLLTDNMNVLGWTLSLISMVQSHIWTSLLLLPFSCNPSLVAAASTKPGLMAKRAEKAKFGRYPHFNLVPFILETTGRPGSHAKKFINYLLRDADNPPIAVRDTWSTIQSVLHSAISKQTTYGCRYVTLGVYSLTQLPVTYCFCLRVPATRFCTQPFSVSSMLQRCYVALLRLHLF